MRDSKQALDQGSLNLPGVVYQGVATIGPAFAILAVFVVTVTYAGIVAPLAFALAGLYGIPSVAYGPGGISEAHTTKEYVAIADLVTAARAYARLMIGWCGLVRRGNARLPPDR
jgi:hypothetical protein